MFTLASSWAPLGPHGVLDSWSALLEGSWYLLTNYNWAYDPTYNWDNPYKAL